MVKPTKIRLMRAVAIPLLLVSGLAGANLSDEMEKVFDGMMVNTTSPSVYMSQTRGMMSAGGVRMRTKIVTPNVLNLQAPQLAGGCGGLDMHFGAFSHISKDQIVQLARSIAQNAAGYAFQIGLDAMCPSCMSNISQLTAAVNEKMSQIGNSCDIATSLVDNYAPSSSEQTALGQFVAVNSAALVDDIYSAKWPGDKKDKTAEAYQADPTKFKTLVGNLTWKAMNELPSSGSWFASGMTTELKHQLMSLIGTIVILPPNSAADLEKAETGFKTRTPTRKILTFEDFMYGTADGRVALIYQCDETVDCINPKVVEATSMKGYVTYVKDILLGTSGTGGLVAKFSANYNAQLSLEEKQLASSASVPLVGWIRNAARISPTTARTTASMAAEMIAFEMAAQMIDEMVRAMEAMVRESKNKHQFMEQLQAQIYRSLDQIHQEKLMVKAKGQHETQLYGAIKAQLEMLPKRTYDLTPIEP